MILKNRVKTVERLPRRAAFTLMEMLVVVAIIVVLAGVGGAFLLGRLEESKVSAARMQAEVIGKAVREYNLNNGVYPPDLNTLLGKDAEGKGPYLETPDALLDPWGRPYQYDQSGANHTRVGATVQIPDVYCMPPNSTDGKPVGNWKEPKR
jgi:general secretion pathway protein G